MICISNPYVPGHGPNLTLMQYKTMKLSTSPLQATYARGLLLPPFQHRILFFSAHTGNPFIPHHKLNLPHLFGRNACWYLFRDPAPSTLFLFAPKPKTETTQHRTDSPDISIKLISSHIDQAKI